MRQAKNEGLGNLLQGLIEIFRATQAKRKYYQLFKLLEKVGFVIIPKETHNIFSSTTLMNIDDAIKAITISPNIHADCHILYIQPKPPDKEKQVGDIDIMSFQDFIAIISKHRDELTTRFIRSLQDWARIKAGQP